MTALEEIFFFFFLCRLELKGGASVSRIRPQEPFPGYREPRYRSWRTGFFHVFFSVYFTFHIGTTPSTDRLAYVTRHRRAPAGQPRAGVRVGGSSGLRVRLYDRLGARCAPGKTPVRSSPVGRTQPLRDQDDPSVLVALQRRPPWVVVTGCCGASSAYRMKLPGGLPDNTDFLIPFTRIPLLLNTRWRVTQRELRCRRVHLWPN